MYMVFIRCVHGKEIRMRSSNSFMLFLTNDPYSCNPRPDLNDPLYKVFTNGYMRAHPNESRDAIDAGEVFPCVNNADVLPRYHSQVFTKEESSSRPSFQTLSGCHAICHPNPSFSMRYSFK